MRSLVAVLFYLIYLTLFGCSNSGQPRSSQKYWPVRFVEWIWCGSLTSQSAVIKAKLAAGLDSVSLLVGREPDLSNAAVFRPIGFDAESQVFVFEPSGLSPDAVYYYAVESGGTVDLVRPGRFRTSGEGPYSFTFAFGSCARTASNAVVFDTIRNQAPLFFVHLGDLHYADLTATETLPYRQVLDHVLASPAQSLLFRNIPVVYMWDDHDYGLDGSDSSNPGRSAVRRVYRTYVPHYLLSAGDGDHPIYQAFSVGRVRFVVTDVRSERMGTAPPRERTMLGQAQKAWLKAEVARSRSEYPLVIWCNPVPWIGAESVDADSWAGFSQEREELAGHIARSRPEGLLMISADAHMLAMDDGSNSDYSGSGGAAFPVFHAAAFDRAGGVKGGPYSHGVIPGGGHFGLVDIRDQGNSLMVRLSGRDWQNHELMSHEFTVPVRSR